MVSRFKKLIKDEEKLKVIICALIYALALNAPRLMVEQPPKLELTYKEIRTLLDSKLFLRGIEYTSFFKN